MRKTLKVLIIAFSLIIVAEGVYLAYLITNTDRMVNKELPALEEKGKEVVTDLQKYLQEERRIRDRYPVAAPRGWLNLINEALTTSGVQIARVQKGEASSIKGSDARRLLFNIEIRAENKKLLVTAASAVEKIDPAVIVSSFGIPPRRSETAPYTCAMEVTIYERSAGDEDNETAEPEPSPVPTKAAPPPDNGARPDNGNPVEPQPEPPAPENPQGQ